MVSQYVTNLYGLDDQNKVSGIANEKTHSELFAFYSLNENTTQLKTQYTMGGNIYLINNFKLV